MSTIVSLGSVNVDKVVDAADADVDALERRYDWFPDRGQTVEVGTIPEGFPGAPDRVFHGGKGANQAAAAARAGADSLLLGKVGSDAADSDVRGRLAEAGVDTTGIGTDGSAPTGTAWVFVEDDGENRIVVRPGANEAVDRAFVRERYDTIAAADCLLLQNEVPTAPVKGLLDELAREPDRPTVVLDPAPAEGAAPLLDADAVDYVTPNESEYDALRSKLEAFEGTLVRKRGPEDVIVDAEREFTVSPPAVPVTDTTGAGDVLNGVLGARLAAGVALPEAVEDAATAASLATRERGARNGVPTLEDVRAFEAATHTA